MSVSSILTSLSTQIGTTLGATWSELDYVYELERNNFRNGEKGFAIGASSGSNVAGTNKAITLDFGFFVVLTQTHANRSSDSGERSALTTIYDAFENINDDIFQKKLNNSSVLVVQGVEYSAPEIVNKGTIAVRVDFTIKYRNETV